MKRASATRRAPKAPALPPDGLLAAGLRAQSDGVFIANRQFTARGLKILFVNDSFCAMTGHSAAKLVGRAHGTLHLHQSDVARVQRWLAKARIAQPLAGEGYLVRADGSTIYAAWNFALLRDARDRITHIVATYRDTTEKRRLQEALMHSQRLDAIGRLAGGVAHDFNNLISVINGYSEILAGQLTDHPQALREVEEIHQAGQKAATLTRQLLAFSRRQSMNTRVISLNHVVRENTEILQRLLGDSGRLELQLAPDLGNVRADPAQFQQVLLNLVINARDALGERGCVTVSTANRVIRSGLNRRVTDMPPGQYVVLIVNDNGSGIDAQTQAHLFEPFFTTKDEGKGTGLGLALVYGVVQQSNGYIFVHSALQVGSTFEILLPTVRGPAENTGNTPVSGLPSTLGHETVLLVDEDAIVNKMVTGILTADGYRVLTAPRASDALRVVRRSRHSVQLLIASLGVPGSENEKLARALRTAHTSLRVLNTGPLDSPAVAWLDADHQARLPKPFALSELLKAARLLLDTEAQ